MQFDESLLMGSVFSFIWPLFRIAGFFFMAPVFSSKFITIKLRLLMSLMLASVFYQQSTLFIENFTWAELLLTAAQELLLGLAMAMTVQFVFDALIVAGQTIAMSMGLGFSTMIDPLNGNSVPVISQIIVLSCMLLFLSLDGHLSLISLLQQSFVVLPIGEIGDFFWHVESLVKLSSLMFSIALHISLPCIAAILLVQLSFAVISRAAPSMNLFAVGFPMTILMGFIFIFIMFEQILSTFIYYIDQQFIVLSQWLQ